MFDIPPSHIPTPGYLDFFRDGCIAIEECMFDEEDLDGAAQWTRENAPTDDYVRRSVDGWRHSEHVKRLAKEPRVLSWLHRMFGRAPVPIHTLNFKIGTEQPIHADAIHYYVTPENYFCSLWIALEDIDDSSGPFVYYPGSHLLPFLGPNQLSLPQARPSQVAEVQRSMFMYHQKIRELVEQSGFECRRVLLKKGQSLLWCANLLHGGSPIADPARTRLSQVNQYSFEGCRFVSPIFATPKTAANPAPIPTAMLNG